jgi:hypothetical protein
MELIGIHNGILQLLSNEMKAVFVTALVFSCSFSFIMAQTLTWTMTKYDDAACQRQSTGVPLSGASGVCQVAGNQGGSYNCDGTNLVKKMYRVGGGDCSGTFTIEETRPLNTCQTTSSGNWMITCKNPVSSGNAITITSLSVVVAVLSLCL